jgi:hypothetical protein
MTSLSKALALANKRGFTAASGAGVGFNRPGAGDEKWFTDPRCRRLSGAIARPGIPRARGVNQAGLDFAIDKDERAVISGDRDCGVGGDANRGPAELSARFART